MVQFSGGSVTIRGGILYFSRARAREGFGDISGILAVFGGGRAAADDFAIFEKGLFLRGSKRFRYHHMQEVVPCCAIFAKLQNSLIQPRTSQNKFSLFENVSFLVNPKIGGISERAHMRRQSAGPPWCGVVPIMVSFLTLKMFIFGEPQYRGYFRKSSYEGAV